MTTTTVLTNEVHEADGTPILIAERHGTGQLRVWCRYCDRYHFHGLPAGHRLAHCIVPDSPYLTGGYTLMVGLPGSAPRPPRAEHRRPRADRWGKRRHGWEEER